LAPESHPLEVEPLAPDVLFTVARNDAMKTALFSTKSDNINHSTLKLASVLLMAVTAFAQTPGAVVYSVNTASDLTINGSTTYNPSDIIKVNYMAPAEEAAFATQYELFIDGVVVLYNSTSDPINVEIIITNSSPLCGSPYGTPVFGPGRVMTVTVQPYSYQPVPMSVIDWVNAGNGSTAHLQYRHASAPGLLAKQYSWLDVKMVPASSIGVANTPNETNCPAE
jgi:hypothetical protein